MHFALIALSFVEIAVFVVVVALYLMKLASSLEHSRANLGKVSTGVRAVEGHCAPIGPVVTKVNDQLRVIADEFATLAKLAGTAVQQTEGRRRRS